MFIYWQRRLAFTVSKPFFGLNIPNRPDKSFRYSPIVVVANHCLPRLYGQLARCQNPFRCPAVARVARRRTTRQIELRGGLTFFKLKPVERWLSGLRHTPGKRAWLKPTEGSNPSLSASSLAQINSCSDLANTNTIRLVPRRRVE